MENQRKQSLKLQPKASHGLRLSESAESKAKLNLMIMGCFSVQKLYGRDTGNAETITDMFHLLLASYPAGQCIRAFEVWLERSPEFPTPADIIGIIKRKGKAPLSREVYIAISKKDPEFRDASDWRFLRDYEQEQREEVSGFEDPVKGSALMQENVGLRQQVNQLKAETTRLGDLLHDARVAKGLEKPKPSAMERILATVDEMRKIGAPESDIEEFQRQQGVEGV